MNCHSFCMQESGSDAFSTNVRYMPGPTLLTDGDIEKLDTKTERTISALVYPAWHPSGRYVAFSTNDTKQDFHLSDANRWKCSTIDRMSWSMMWRNMKS